MLNILKEKIFSKISDMADIKEKVVFEDYETNEKFKIETYTVIVKLSYDRFRIYQAMLHSTGNISIKYMTIEKNMLEAMSPSLKISLGEVQ